MRYYTECLCGWQSDLLLSIQEADYRGDLHTHLHNILQDFGHITELKKE